MKAWVLKKPAPIDERPLQLVEASTPTPAEDEVLIQVDVCGICRTDLHVVEGDLPVKLEGVIPGHQIVGRVIALGEAVTTFKLGDRVGVAWLGRTCGQCEFCLRGSENLCERPVFTGWTTNGGYAEYVTSAAAFTYSLPENFSDAQAAPLLCAGIIGYRCLRQTGLSRAEWNGARLGIFGFGAAGHVCIQIARARGAEVYVFTRDRERHQALAKELGATWVGDSQAKPSVKLDAAIIFAPAGELVPVALQSLNKGGVVVLGGIHMSPIPSFDYSLIYGERILRSVANNTREDGREFLAEAARITVETHVDTFPFEHANEALLALKTDAIRGAGVLVIGS
jgi:propanol-preferring alcohol dehydrogenase